MKNHRHSSCVLENLPLPPTESSATAGRVDTLGSTSCRGPKALGPLLATIRGRTPAGGLLVCAAVFLAVMSAAGCGSSESTPQRRSVKFVDQDEGRKLFESAIGLLNSLENYDDLNDPKALEQIVIRLNKWVDADQPSVEWTQEPRLDELPEPFRQLHVMRVLDSEKFQTYDGLALREALWLRKISESARGDQVDDIARATRLFDWVVRNIQLDGSQSSAKSSKAVTNLPWHALMLGHGDANFRAWIFMLLARQQQLDVAMLALGDPGEPERLGMWVPALLSDGELYLFETRLGMPIPGPGGEGVATLSQAVSDPSVLRQLDLDNDQPYPMKSEDLESVVALVETSPLYLARRMKLIETQLAGENRLVLYTDPTSLCKSLAACDHVADAQIWRFPIGRYLAQAQAEDALVRSQAQGNPEEARAAMLEATGDLQPFQVGLAILWRNRDPEKVPEGEIAKYGLSPLWKGRSRHLLGIYTGDSGAIEAYQAARPAKSDLDSAELPPEILEAYEKAKQHASYWLGLLAYDRGHYDTAVDYFAERTLAASPGGPWTEGARYNLARAYEAKGEVEEAASQLEASRSPQRHGDLLRARQLRAGEK